MLVVDASIVLALLLDDENFASGKAVTEAMEDHTAIAPSLFWYEVRNALLVGERRQRLSESETQIALDVFALLPIRISDNLPSDHAIVLARKHNLSIYDSAYLDLAIQHSGFLASLDRRLIAAAKLEGVGTWQDLLRPISP